MYARLIQGYEAMDPELKTASASAARHLRLMVNRLGFSFACVILIDSTKHN